MILFPVIQWYLLQTTIVNALGLLIIVVFFVMPCSHLIFLMIFYPSLRPLSIPIVAIPHFIILFTLKGVQFNLILPLLVEGPRISQPVTFLSFLIWAGNAGYFSILQILISFTYLFGKLSHATAASLKSCNIFFLFSYVLF